MSHPFDATLKEIVRQTPADFQATFRLPTTEPVTTLNVDLSTISAATDVTLGFGKPLKEIVDLNFQSGLDSTVAARLHLYNAALHLKYLVPVRSVLILLRSKANVPGLTGKMAYRSGGKEVIFEYDVIRLWREPVHHFLEGGVGLLPLAPLCRMPPGKPFGSALREVVHEIDRRLALLPDHAAAVRLMSAAYTLVESRVGKASLSSIFEGVRIMHNPTVWDEIDDAELRVAKRILLRLGRSKFGQPAKKEKSALEAIKELARLERMAEELLNVSSWKEAAGRSVIRSA